MGTPAATTATEVANAPRVWHPRVAIFEDDEFVRAGYEALLGRSPELDLVSAADSRSARAWRPAWDLVETFVVDPVDPHAATDQFPGVRVIEEIRGRAHCFGARPTVLAVSSCAHDDALRLRLREAGADYVYSRSAVSRATELVGAIRRPSLFSTVQAPIDRVTLDTLGITPRTLLNCFVNHIADQGLESVLRRGAVLKQAPISSRSRWWMNLRQELAELSRIAARNCDGHAPHREQCVPSIAQFRRVFDWATRIKPLPRTVLPSEEVFAVASGA